MVSASQKRKSLFDFPGSAGATGFGRMETYTAASTCARTSAVTGGYPRNFRTAFNDAYMSWADVDTGGKVFLCHAFFLSCSFNTLSNCLCVHRSTSSFRT